MELEHDLLKTLEESEEDVVNGSVAPIKNTFDDIRKLLKENGERVRSIKN